MSEMKALVFGYGKMGQAITFGMNKLGFKTVVVDKNLDAEDVPYHSSGYGIDCSNPISVGQIISDEKPNVVISSLPYYCNYTVAEQAAICDIPYCDLGGHVGTSKVINHLGNYFDADVFTDLGLAPGWINIEAENEYRKAIGDDVQVNDVHMYVGGLPVVSNTKKLNPLKYELTWSFEGLWNEYMDDCEMIHDYHPVSMPGMSCLRPFSHLKTDEPLESFATSGGSAHTVETMLSRGVRNCSYNTVRYRGHTEVFKWLHKNLDKYQIEKMIPKCENDMVLMKVRVGGTTENGYVDYEWQNQVTSLGGFSAMQRATAFPLCGVAKQMVENKKNRPWDYTDVNHKALHHTNNKLVLSGGFNVT